MQKPPPLPVAAVCLLLAPLFGCGDGSPGRALAKGGGLSLSVEPEDPFRHGSVPEFELVSQLGESVTRDDLLGRPFVLGAIFTTCSGPCPSITKSMRRLQDELIDTDVRLVSVSVHPAFDSPEILAEYARSWGADDERWLFLTGAEADVYSLVQGGFLMSAVKNEGADVPPGERVTHDTRLVAVDRYGLRAGWYDGRDEEAVDRLAERLRFLAAEE